MLKLMAVGDITLETKNHAHPFQEVEKLLKEKDLLFGNLETVLSETGIKTKKSFVFHSAPKNAEFLKEAGFDVLNIANNHMLDLGYEGFKNTLSALGKHGLNFIGVTADKCTSSHLILERNNIKLGFLGYTIGRFREHEIVSLSKLKENRIISDIKSIQKKCNYVVVSLHWGTENVFYPSPKQIELAHKLIDHGATLILGHHPHVIQGIEEYKNGLIVYSLGNFQFANKLSQGRINDSIILSVDFDENGIIDYEITPVIINGDFIPSPVEGNIKENILKFVSQISDSIVNKDITNRWWFEEIGFEYLSSNMKSYIIRIKKYGIMPFFECCVWLLTPFCIKCYFGIIRRKLKEA